MKKSLSLFLVFAILFGLFAFFPSESIAADSEPFDIEGVYNAILSSVENFSSFIDLRSFKIPAYILGQNLFVDDAYTAIVDRLRMDPHLYFVDFTKSSVTVLSNDNIMYGMTPKYSMTKAEAENAAVYIEEETDKLLDLLPTTKGLTDVQKCIALHDLIVSEFAFDDYTTYRTLYDMLKNRKGVCQGYTILYSYLLDKLGVETAFSKSDAMAHVWSLVKLDSDWYHVDCTWDDPISDICPGYVAHEYLLKSDDAFITDDDPNGHYAVIDDYDCTSKKYDDAFWNSLTSPIYYTDAETYWYIAEDEEGHGKLVKCQNNKQTPVFSIDDFWYVYDEKSGDMLNAYYIGCFSGLAYYKNSFYFNGGYTIYRYDIASGIVSEIKKINNKNGYINTLYLRGNTLYYQQSKDMYDYGTTYSIDISEYSRGLTDALPDDCEIVNNGDKSFVKGIKAGTVGSLSLPSYAVVRGPDGKVLGKTALIPSGAVIEITSSSVVIESAVIVISGDVDQDGKIGESDQKKVRANVLGDGELTEIQFLASDFDSNGIVDMEDYIAIRLNADNK